MSLPLTSVELFFPKSSPIFATINLIYTLLISSGILILTYTLTRVYFPKIPIGIIIALTFTAIAALKMYDYIDWVITDLPYAELTLNLSNIILLASAITLVAAVFISYRSTRIELLKSKLILLAISIACLLTELIIIIVPGNLLQPHRYLTGIILILSFTIIGAFAVTYKHNELAKLIGIEAGKLSASGRADERIAALLSRYTSKENMCEHYQSQLKSKCSLDPQSYRIEDCKGVKYQNGVICHRIIEREKKNREN